MTTFDHKSINTLGEYFAKHSWRILAYCFYIAIVLAVFAAAVVMISAQA